MNYFKVNLLLLLISTDMGITISVSFYIRELDSGFSLIAFHVFDFALCGLFFLICFFLKLKEIQLKNIYYEVNLLVFPDLISADKWRYENEYTVWPQKDF